MWDVDFQTAVAQAEMEDRRAPGRVPPGRLQPRRRRRRGHDRHHAARVDRGVRRARRPSRRRPVQAAVRHDRHHAAVRRRVCRSSPTSSPQPDKGTGIAMICTFGDVTDVIWWRELDLPTRAIIGRNGRIVADAPDGVDADGLRSDRRRDDQAGAARGRRATARVRRADRRTAPDRASGQVLREGRAPARDRRQPAVVHPQRRPLQGAPARADRPRARDDVASGPHAAPLRELGRRPQRRLARQPPALLRRARSGLVPPRRARRTRLRQAAAAGEDVLPIDPSTDVPDGYTAEQRNQPNGFTGDPDVFDTWATSSLTPADRGVLGGSGQRPLPRACSRWTCGRRPTTSSARGCSPRSCAATTSTMPRRGRTARCPGGSSTPTARRCRSRRATSSRRWICSTRTAATPCATGRRAPAPAPTPPSAKIR